VLKKVSICKADEHDYPAVVMLNDLAVEFTSPMNMERLSYLASLAAYFRVAKSDGQVVAFLLAMKDGVPYQNDNYSWFSSHYQKFLYIDRVVVAGEFQGSGIGTQLYQDIFSYARQEEIPILKGRKKFPCRLLLPEKVVSDEGNNAGRAIKWQW